jgi:hypothetical protein
MIVSSVYCKYRKTKKRTEDKRPAKIFDKKSICGHTPPHQRPPGHHFAIATAPLLHVSAFALLASFLLPSRQARQIAPGRTDSPDEIAPRI